ncbi:hypothetical protein RUM43_002663 [Polyplax serrata]|uniref:Anaphase-promoting complex subunit 5 n=1 Tax=Polyplax serrata TaxID=468196 RepID=A0AAN8PE90_POLSC
MILIGAGQRGCRKYVKIMASSLTNGLNLDGGMETGVDNSAYIRGFCMLSLKLIQSPDIDFNSLKDLISGKTTGYKISPLLQKKFQEQVDELLEEGVGALLDMIGSAGRLIGSAIGQVTRSSGLGLFLRRVLLYFDKLPFSQIVQLHKQYEIYVDPKKNPVLGEDENGGKWSRKQAELFFAQGAAKLSVEAPASLQAQITQLLQSNPSYAEAHFLTFLNCVRSKEFCGAKNSVHHCFDRASLPPDKSASTTLSSNAMGFEERTFRYASLSLSAMHASFGHKEEATDALKEAIKLAHRAGDSVCLQHSLAWLYTLTHDNKEALIERSMAKCTELGLSYLMSLGVQSYTKYCGLTGGRPSVVFDVLMRSDVLNCQHMLSELAANSYCLKAALWTLYGQSNMASLCSQQLLRLESKQSSVCLAMCNVARALADQGDYDFGFAVLSEAQERFPRKESAAWMAGFQEILYMFSANESKYNEALKAVAMLAPIQPWESVLRKSWILHWQGDDVEAMKLAHSTLSYCRDGWYADPELIPLKVRALIAAADTLNTGEALGSLFYALGLSQTYYLHHLAAFVTLHIANIQLNMGLTSRALRLTEASLPTVLSHGSVQARGRALLLLAKCKLARGKKHKMGNLQQAISILSLAQDWLKKARDHVRVKHCYYLKALIYNELGAISERNKCSYEFRHLDITHPTPVSFGISF